jgi:O-acetyl-ADP-ribose deacetylase (regulator of RNase III)
MQYHTRHYPADKLKSKENSMRRQCRLPAQFVIHTVGPVWRGGTQGEPELLASCYCRSMEVAVADGISSLAFHPFAREFMATPLSRRRVWLSIRCDRHIWTWRVWGK